jgi:hypothetical protein
MKYITIADTDAATIMAIITGNFILFYIDAKL